MKGDGMNDRDLRNAEYGRDVSWGDADDGVESDNGMLDPAETDLASSEAIPEKPDSDAWSQEQRLDFLEREVCRHPLNRELLYKTLELCFEPLELSALEQRMLSFPEASQATQDPYHLACLLEDAGGLRRIELDEEGCEVTDLQKQDLTEDEVDDLVASVQFETTEVGRTFVCQHDPRRRLAELLDAEPVRKSCYIELLGFCNEQPRTYAEIEALLRSNAVLLSEKKSGLPLQPSVFVDKLERAGILEWRDGWSLSQEGRGCLDALKGE